jgi:hypothetical protein
MESSNLPSTSPEPLDVAMALRRVLGSGGVDWDLTSCPEVVRILDEYAERMLAGEDVSECMPIVKQHLDECPDCCAECDALLRILGFSSQEQQVGN